MTDTLWRITAPGLRPHYFRGTEDDAAIYVRLLNLRDDCLHLMESCNSAPEAAQLIDCNVFNDDTHMRRMADVLGMRGAGSAFTRGAADAQNDKPCSPPRGYSSGAKKVAYQMGWCEVHIEAGRWQHRVVGRDPIVGLRTGLATAGLAGRHYWSEWAYLNEKEAVLLALALECGVVQRRHRPAQMEA